MNSLLIISTLGLGLVLFRLVVLDLRLRRLPDKYTLTLILAGLGVNAVWERGLPQSAILGTIFGFGVFWLIGAAYYRLRGVDGLGLGDAKLLAAAGAWLGVSWLPLVVLIAASGSLIFVIWKGLTVGQTIPLGPGLAAAFFALWVFRLFGQLG